MNIDGAAGRSICRSDITTDHRSPYLLFFLTEVSLRARIRRLSFKIKQDSTLGGMCFVLAVRRRGGSDGLCCSKHVKTGGRQLMKLLVRAAYHRRGPGGGETSVDNGCDFVDFSFGLKRLSRMCDVPSYAGVISVKSRAICECVYTLVTSA